MRPIMRPMTQDFDGAFWMERAGYLRTDIVPHRGARYRWNLHAKYRRDLHLACDFGAAVGTPVYAVHDGKIVAQGRDGTGGYYIYQQIRVGRVYKVIALYYHLQAGSFRFKQGDFVRRGQVIARSGNTGGLSTGGHLHFSITRYLRGVVPSLFYFGANAIKSTGAFGLSFDPVPFFNGMALTKIAP